MADRVQRIGVFGSTGSIGESTLSLIRENPDRFSVHSLIAGSNVEKLCAQAKEFRPHIIGIEDASRVSEVKEFLVRESLLVELAVGSDEIADIARSTDLDIMLGAIVGISGLRSVYTAAQAGKIIALANKESLVCGGSLITEELSRSGGCIFPVDSEHSALFQAIQGNRAEDISRLILTASGGPFLKTPLSELSRITPEQALQHPRWKMGPKVTIDSSTMFNKALELIEAHWLFHVDEGAIDVVVHPQSIVHSLVEYVDGSTIAQLSHPDMRGPIAFALGLGNARVPRAMRSLKLEEVGRLEFLPLDSLKFPAVNLAREVLRSGGGAGVVFNGANEIAVQSFLTGAIAYLDIIKIVSEALSHFGSPPCASLSDVLELDQQVRQFCKKQRNSFK